MLWLFFLYKRTTRYISNWILPNIYIYTIFVISLFIFLPILYECSVLWLLFPWYSTRNIYFLFYLFPFFYFLFFLDDYIPSSSSSVFFCMYVVCDSYAPRYIIVNFCFVSLSVYLPSFLSYLFLRPCYFFVPNPASWFSPVLSLFRPNPSIHRSVLWCVAVALPWFVSPNRPCHVSTVSLPMNIPAPPPPAHPPRDPVLFLRFCWHSMPCPSNPHQIEPLPLPPTSVPNHALPRAALPLTTSLVVSRLDS